MSTAAERERSGEVLARVQTLVADRPDGLTVGEISAAVGKPSALMGVLLRTYVANGRLEARGQRPNTRYVLGPRPRCDAPGPAPVAPAAMPKAWEGVSRDAVIAALRGLLQALGLTPHDLVEEQSTEKTPFSAAVRQLVTPPATKPTAKPAPAPKPAAAAPRVTSLPRAPGPKPVERRSFVPLMPQPIRLQSSGDVVVPDHVTVTVCPGGTDARFTADPSAEGAGFLSQWRQLRGEQS